MPVLSSTSRKVKASAESMSAYQYARSTVELFQPLFFNWNIEVDHLTRYYDVLCQVGATNRVAFSSLRVRYAVDLLSSAKMYDPIERTKASDCLVSNEIANPISDVRWRCSIGAADKMSLSFRRKGRFPMNA